MNAPFRLPSLDAHAHIAQEHSVSDLAGAGAVLAMTLSLEEASHAVGRTDPLVLWGAGCHPTDPKAQENFDVTTFRSMVQRAPVVGEVGLDRRSDVPFERQLKIFREILKVVADYPRIVSIHSSHATAEVLDELQRSPVSAPVLHWWNGSNSRTRTAVEIGCCFSVNAGIATYSRFTTIVPLQRILVETDQGYEEPPSGIPARIEQAERTLSSARVTDPEAIRRSLWRNFANLMEKTDTKRFVSEEMGDLLKDQAGRAAATAGDVGQSGSD